jgi:CRISPR-associated protein Cmr2
MYDTPTKQDSPTYNVSNESSASPTARVNKGGASEILLFQPGPVQDFIAQARSMRDLWSGSFMLSWLMANALREVVTHGGLHDEDVVFPSLKDNPLMLALRDRKAPVTSELALIPSLPNRFLVLVPKGTAVDLAGVAAHKIREELENMGKAVWQWLLKNGVSTSYEERWKEQIKAFPQMTWAYTAWSADEPWRDAYMRVNANLTARRNTCDFAQWNPVSTEAAVKDSLSGKEECIGDEAFWDGLRQNPLFAKTRGHRYGAMNLIKRLWMHVGNVDADDEINYLADKLNFKEREVWRTLRVKGLPSIVKDDKTGSYVALLAMSGDKMGAILAGDESPNADSPQYQTKVSQALSAYVLHDVPDLVSEQFRGHLIYAGGDDVLAILPADQAIACARALRNAFKARGQAFGFEASCGIAVGHQNAPLQMLVKGAQSAEQRAKHDYGRAALAISLYKRSGEIIEWGCRWESGALDLMDKITRLTEAGKLSGRFPYALAALLQPYALDDEKDTAKLAAMLPVVQTEVRHVLSRQGARFSGGERDALATEINRYLETCWRLTPESGGVAGSKAQEAKRTLRPQDFINLFRIEAFINSRHGGN